MKASFGASESRVPIYRFSLRHGRLVAHLEVDPQTALWEVPALDGSATRKEGVMPKKWLYRKTRPSGQAEHWRGARTVLTAEQSGTNCYAAVSNLTTIRLPRAASAA